MKTRLLELGLMLVCLLPCLISCTPAQSLKPLEVHAAQPITVTRTEYIGLSERLTAEVEPAWGFFNVWTNGDMYNSLVHDSQWLTTCKGQIDGIREAEAAQVARNAAKPPEKAAAAPAKGGGL